MGSIGPGPLAIFFNNGSHIYSISSKARALRLGFFWWSIGASRVSPSPTLPLTMATTPPIESVQCFGRKKTAVAVTYCKRGRGLIKINGCPIELVEPEILKFKAIEPILLLGVLG